MENNILKTKECKNPTRTKTTKNNKHCNADSCTVKIKGDNKIPKQTNSNNSRSL
jgi:hypothetical protein